MHIPKPRRGKKSRVKVEQPPLENANGTNIDSLPDELLLQVFAALAGVGAVQESHPQVCWMPFRTIDCPQDPHPGLRSYPFLGQVCRRWKDILSTPVARECLWKEVVVDFGHELITAVHTPIAWSDRRPSDEEFRQSFATTKLSATKILDFFQQRVHITTRLVLLNSEGYWSDEGDFVSLNQKHNFTVAHFGLLLGMLRTTLQEVRVQHCSDIFQPAHGALGVLGAAPALRKLSLEDLHCRVDRDSLAELGQLTNLEELSISAEEHVGAWAVGIECLPKEWANLRALRKLELRGHSMLHVLPAWLADLPALEHLDVAACKNNDISILPQMTRLRTLSLQGLDLVEAPDPAAPPPELPNPRRVLPALERLTGLTALSLADNSLKRVPPMLTALTRLHFLDLSSNEQLRVPAPLTILQNLPALQSVDLRGIHEEVGVGYWSDDKCCTMNHVAALAKTLKRRQHGARVYMEVN